MSGVFDEAAGWKPVTRSGLIGWLVFYGLFLIIAARDTQGFLPLDHVNLVFHEAGHMLFAWFGYTISILGGTLGELLVPLAVAIYFYRRRETPGLAFAAFWFFENFLYIGTYMADARTQDLPLVGSGDHDWNILFSQWGVLMQDRTIGAATRSLGWLGMIGVIAWLVWMHLRTTEDQRMALPKSPGRSD